jgi:hypothetical protein
VTADKRFHVTPEQAYDLVHAALSIAVSPSPKTLKAVRAGTYVSRPGLAPDLLNKLCDALDAIDPDLIARAYG